MARGRGLIRRLAASLACLGALGSPLATAACGSGCGACGLYPLECGNPGWGWWWQPQCSADLDPCLRRLGPCAGACESGLLAGRLWFRTELLAWATDGYRLPALATTSSVAPPATAGQRDQPDTATLFGGTDVHDELRSGGRLTAGWWFTPEQRTGVELGYFGIDGQDVAFAGDAATTPVIARPYVDAVGLGEEAELVAYPGLLAGSLAAKVDSEFSGAEVLVRRAAFWNSRWRIDWLAGYRYARLRDSVEISQTSESLDAASGFPAGSVVERTDRFRLVNNFHGGQLGVAGRWWHGPWSLSSGAKGALGGNAVRSGIGGTTVVSTPAGAGYDVATYDGGLLAARSNSGSRTVDRGAVLAQFDLTLEYQLRYDMRLAVGYSLLGWSDVARMDALLPASLNPSQIPPGALAGEPVPGPPTPGDDAFWAQGLHVSFEYQF